VKKIICCFFADFVLLPIAIPKKEYADGNKYRDSQYTFDLVVHSVTVLLVLWDLVFHPSDQW